MAEQPILVQLDADIDGFLGQALISQSQAVAALAPANTILGLLSG